MDFLQNPFHILDVAPQDNRRRIMEQADARSLFWDPEECRNAATILTNPRRRLYAEIAWLPCTRLNHVDDIFELLHDYSFGAIELTPIAHANLVAAKLQRLPDYSSEDVASRIRQIARSFEAIDGAQLRAVINAQRKVSHFPIVNLADIESEIQSLGDYYQKVMTSALEKLSAKQRAEVMTLAVALATRRAGQLPRLINRLVDSYEVDAHEPLAEHEAKIAELDEKLRLEADEDRPDSALSPLVNQLIHAVKHWNAIAQPIQLSKKTRGLSHKGSSDLAWRVRELALYLCNEHGKLDFCQELINMLREVFAEVSEVANIINEDTKTLGEIAQQQTRLAQSLKQFERIKEQVDTLQTAADAKKSDSILRPMVIGLTQSVNKWDAAAQPIEANQSVSLLVRGLALHLWNEHGKLDLSLQLTNVLQKVFGGVDDIANRLAEDTRVLNQFAKQRARMIEGVEKFEKIKDQVEKLRGAADAERSDAFMNSMAAELIQSLNIWDDSTQPIEANQSVSLLVRGLALHLWNEHGKLDLSLQLTDVLQKVFGGVGDIANRLAEDTRVLNQLAQQRARTIEASVNESRGGGYGCLIFLLLGILGALLQAC